MYLHCLVCSFFLHALVRNLFKEGVATEAGMSSDSVGLTAHVPFLT